MDNNSKFPSLCVKSNHGNSQQNNNKDPILEMQTGLCQMVDALEYLRNSFPYKTYMYVGNITNKSNNSQSQNNPK